MTEKLFRILNEPHWIRQDIKDMESELEAYRQTMLLSGISYDGDKVKTSPKDRMPDYVVRVEKILNNIKGKQQAYLRAHDRVKSLADKLRHDEKTIVIMRYLEGKGYEDIADSFPMSLSNMYRIRQQAINRLEGMAAGIDDSSEME